jgi:death-on-curing protein
LPNEPRWLTPAEVTELNKAAVAATGEPFVVLNQGLLESACDRPRNLFLYEDEHDIAVLATRLFVAIARNHAFGQGNKRAAFAAADAFLYLNGYDLVLADTVEVASIITQVVASELPERDLEVLLAEAIRPLSD